MQMLNFNYLVTYCEWDGTIVNKTVQLTIYQIIPIISYYLLFYEVICEQFFKTEVRQLNFLFESRFSVTQYYGSFCKTSTKLYKLPISNL